MRLTWNGHSCFTLETDGGTLVVDPYAPGSVPGFSLPRLQADQVFCSHGHADHGAADQVVVTGGPCTVEVERLETFHDPEQGALRGPNTIHIFGAEGLRVAHLGDLGCDLTPEQKEALSHLDALMIPVGGYYTIDAQQAGKLVEELQPRVVIPMHYRGPDYGYPVLAPLEEFLSLCTLPVQQVGRTFSLTSQTAPQVAVFAL